MFAEIDAALDEAQLSVKKAWLMAEMVAEQHFIFQIHGPMPGSSCRMNFAEYIALLGRQDENRKLRIKSIREQGV